MIWAWAGSFALLTLALTLNARRFLMNDPKFRRMLASEPARPPRGPGAASPPWLARQARMDEVIAAGMSHEEAVWRHTHHGGGGWCWCDTVTTDPVLGAVRVPEGYVSSWAKRRPGPQDATPQDASPEQWRAQQS